MTAVLALILAFLFALLLVGERLLVRWNIIPLTRLVKLQVIALALLAGAFILIKKYFLLCVIRKACTSC